LRIIIKSFRTVEKTASPSGIFKNTTVFSTASSKKFFLSCYEIEHPMAGNWKDCQNLSKENLFTIARHSGAKKARLGALFGSRLMENRGGKA
jgi:hypothetical protein